MPAQVRPRAGRQGAGRALLWRRDRARLVAATVDGAAPGGSRRADHHRVPRGMSWLVTGGSGYIGAHVVDALHARDEQAVVLDDFSTGERGRTGDAAVVEGSILDGELVRRTMREHGVRGIIHIAAKKQVGESVADPLKYYRANVAGTIGLLDAAVDVGVESFVFSSSAATYGMPADVEIVTEDAPTEPLSPYGTSKLIGEWAARDVAAATGLRVISLRYFNVAGAARPELGDPGVFNLIPM